MVHSVLRECINSTEKWLLLDFNLFKLFYVTFWTYLTDSSLSTILYYIERLFIL